MLTRLALGFAALLVSCGTSGEPESGSLEQSLLQSDDPRYTYLITMDDVAGHKGNRCDPTIAFNPLCSVTMHEDFSCFERQTPLEGGWVKQVIHALHCE